MPSVSQFDNLKVRETGLVSLYDLMLRYRLDMLAVFLASCEIVSRDCLYMDKLGKESMGGDEWSVNFSKIIKGLGFAMEQMDADRSLESQIEIFAREIERGADKRPAVINAGLKPIITGVQAILQNRLIMFIPEDQAVYYMNIRHFGNAVAMFPGAVPDMFETSNCYAAGRATACIFHAMRVSEHGLRYLGDELGVDTGTPTKPLPIDYATWEAVLIGIEKARADLRKQVKSKEHEEKTRAFADLANQCSHLKDLWRNPTMHARGLYDMPEALSAMGRVAEFMKLITASEHAKPLDSQRVEMMKNLLMLTDGLTSRD